MRSRRPLLTSVAAVATLLAGAAGAYAGGVVSADGSGTKVANLLVTIDGSSPTAGNPCGDDGNVFETVTMSVGADGGYSFRDARHRSNLFDRAQYYPLPQSSTDVVECSNLFVAEDDFSPAVPLRAGTVYGVVLEAFPEDEPGDYGLVATTVDDTVGTVTFGGATDVGSPTRIGGQEVTGNGTTLATIDYTIDATSPTALDFPRDSASPCDQDDPLPGRTSYETVRMQVTETGSYRFRALYTTGTFGEYGYAAVHEGVVSAPGGPGCIETTDASEAVPLRAGVVYTLFLTGDEDGGPSTTAGRWGISVVPTLSNNGRITFSRARLDVDEAVVCAPGGAVPSGYTLREGTARSETLTGTAGDDLIRGLAGNDTIRGLEGDDIVCGGEGQDTVDGGAGADILFGGAGQDTLYGGTGDDRVSGGVGNDTLFGQVGDDELFGGVGSDVLDGGVGTDEGTDTDPRTVFRNVETVNAPAQVPAPTRTGAGR